MARFSKEVMQAIRDAQINLGNDIKSGKFVDLNASDGTRGTKIVTPADRNETQRKAVHIKIDRNAEYRDKAKNVDKEWNQVMASHSGLNENNEYVMRIAGPYIINGKPSKNHWHVEQRTMKLTTGPNGQLLPVEDISQRVVQDIDTAAVHGKYDTPKDIAPNQIVKVFKRSKELVPIIDKATGRVKDVKAKVTHSVDGKTIKKNTELVDDLNNIGDTVTSEILGSGTTAMKKMGEMGSWKEAANNTEIINTAQTIADDWVHAVREDDTVVPDVNLHAFVDLEKHPNMGAGDLYRARVGLDNMSAPSKTLPNALQALGRQDKSELKGVDRFAISALTADELQYYPFDASTSQKQKYIGTMINNRNKAAEEAEDTSADEDVSSAEQPVKKTVKKIILKKD